MNDTKHTPGPWFVDRSSMVAGHESAEIRTSDCEQESALVATVYQQYGDVLANAHLISAAPELLKALEACLPWVDEYVCTGLHEGIGDRVASDKARAAIAKARGKDTHQ